MTYRLTNFDYFTTELLQKVKKIETKKTKTKNKNKKQKQKLHGDEAAQAAELRSLRIKPASLNLYFELKMAVARLIL